MNDKEWRAIHCYPANWMSMASLAFIVVGLFQAEHVFGGLSGSTIRAAAGLT